MHTSGNSSIYISLIRDSYRGPEVLFETCVVMKMKFVDDDNDDLLAIIKNEIMDKKTEGILSTSVCKF